MKTLDLNDVCKLGSYLSDKKSVNLGIEKDSKVINKEVLL
jgi:hypothetical protein